MATTALRCEAHGDTELSPNCPLPKAMVGSWLCPPRVRRSEDPCKMPWGEKKKEKEKGSIILVHTDTN